MRLFPKLFLLVAGAAMSSALATAGVLSWNLTRGFSDYLEARDAEMLEKAANDFRQEVERQAAAGQWPVDKEDLRAAFAQLMREGKIPELSRPRPVPPPPRIAPPGPRPRGIAGPTIAEQGATANRPRPTTPPSAAFGDRLRLHDSQGELLMGPPPAPARLEIKAPRRDIVVAGQTVARLSLLPRGPLANTIDASFLRSQYAGIAAICAMLLVLAAIFAFFLARQGSRRIAAMQAATHAIAGGRFGDQATVQGRDEIASLAQDINELSRNLARLENARRRWLAEISHELRTPLTVLKGEIEAIKDGLRPFDESAIASLAEEVDRLHGLIEDLHLIAVSDRGGISIRTEEIDVRSLLKASVARFRPAAADAGLKLSLVVPKVPVVARWDKQRIEQLLGNLLLNAIRYTDAPGLIRLQLTSRNGGVAITVEDSAPGVVLTCPPLAPSI